MEQQYEYAVRGEVDGERYDILDATGSQGQSERVASWARLEGGT
jgi:hypothetical protein